MKLKNAILAQMIKLNMEPELIQQFRDMSVEEVARRFNASLKR